MFRIVKILRSTMTRESNRLDLGVIRGLFLMVTFGVLLLVLNAPLRPLLMGKYLLTAFFPLSIVLASYLAGRLNRNSIGDGASGFLSLLALTGTTRAEWTIVRLVQIWCGFFSVWIIRWPVLAILYTLGGVMWTDLIAMEFLLILLFACASTWAMVTSQNIDQQKSVDFTGFKAFIALEVLLLLGNIISALLSYIGLFFPTSLSTASTTLADSSLYYRLIRYPGSTGFGVSPMTHDFVINVSLYLSLTFYFLVQFYRRLYATIGDSPQANPTSRKEKKQSEKARHRRLPRCWDDALAWQSYAFYSGGQDNTVGRITLYSIAFLLIVLAMTTGLLREMIALILVVAAVVIINALNTPPQCMDKEEKAKTLTSLVMTPHSGLDLYYGWRRGTFKLVIPDLVFATLSAAVMMLVQPYASLAIVSVTIAALLSGPFFMLSHLVPVSLKGLKTGAFVVFGFILTIAASSIAAAFSHPAVFPLVALPLFWVFNLILLKFFVEPWMIRKIDALH